MLAVRQIWTFLILGLLVACSESPQPAAPADEDGPTPASVRFDPASVKERAAASLQPFKQQLMQALQRGMAQGPQNAIDVCRLEAPAIARRAAGAGIQLGRTSHRLRNPANAPNEWQRRALDHYLGSEDRDSMVMDLGDGRVGYAEPIVTAPLCLTCHGSELSAEVTEALAEHYPSDQATGFSAGELRGIFWVSLPVPDA